MDDHWDPDPYAGRTPLMRRPVVRGSVAVLAALALAIITLMSTCSAGTPTTPEKTTTSTTLVA